MRESIEHIIKTFADKLPEFENVGQEKVYYSGKELKLTGVTSFKGKPLKEDRAYGIKVPILKPIDHHTNLRLAWLKGGLQGLYNYLYPHISEEQMKMVQYYFMHA
jgi:hypothetical protein